MPPVPYTSYRKLHYVTGDSKYVHDEEVERDTVLLVTSITLYSSSIAESDTLEVGVKRGGVYYPVHIKTLPAATEALQLNCLIPLQNGEAIYGYFQDIGTTEEATLTVCGVHMTQDDFQHCFGALVKEVP